MKKHAIALLALAASALTANAQNSTRVDFLVDKANETITVTFSGTYLLNQTGTQFYYVRGTSAESSLHTDNGPTTILGIVQREVYLFQTFVPLPGLSSTEPFDWIGTTATYAASESYAGLSYNTFYTAIYGKTTDTVNELLWNAGIVIPLSTLPRIPEEFKDKIVISNMSGQEVFSFDITVTQVPEPSTYAAILGLGALGFAVARRKLTK